MLRFEFQYFLHHKWYHLRWIMNILRFIHRPRNAMCDLIRCRHINHFLQWHTTNLQKRQSQCTGFSECGWFTETEHGQRNQQNIKFNTYVNLHISVQCYHSLWLINLWTNHNRNQSQSIQIRGYKRVHSVGLWTEHREQHKQRLTTFALTGSNSLTPSIFLLDLEIWTTTNSVVFQITSLWTVKVKKIWKMTTSKQWSITWHHGCFRYILCVDQCNVMDSKWNQIWKSIDSKIWYIPSLHWRKCWNRKHYPSSWDPVQSSEVSSID